MNEHISWDESIVKKYSSSNHYKLLNQLRNEVKKYPLNKNKTISVDSNKNNRINIKDNLTKTCSEDLTSNKIFKLNNEKDNNRLTVSFNNSKNFSIYNNSNNQTMKEDSKSNRIVSKESNDDKSSPSFKDRLNKIDMK